MAEPLNFDEWFKAQYGRVLAAALIATGGDRSLAEDATADAFAKALDRWPRVSAMASPTGWTIRVAVNRSRRRWNRNRRRADLEELTATQESSALPIEVDVELLAAIDRLPRRQREAIVLRYVEDLTQREVASKLGIAPGTAAATIHSARRNLSTMMKAAGRDGH